MVNLNLNSGEYESYIVSRKEDIYDSITKGNLKGVAYRFKFDNGYGASVIKKYGSYGYKYDLWELAVLYYGNTDDPDDYILDYDTTITNDVIGHITDKRVRELLGEIKGLLPRRN